MFIPQDNENRCVTLHILECGAEEFLIRFAYSCLRPLSSQFMNRSSRILPTYVGCSFTSNDSVRVNITMKFLWSLGTYYCRNSKCIEEVTSIQGRATTTERMTAKGRGHLALRP